MAGRPSKLTKQVEADLTVLLAQGVPVKIAASATSVSPRSVRRWLGEGDLRERVAELRATRNEHADATNEARLVVLLLRAAEHDWRAPAWYLERRWPERWGALKNDDGCGPRRRGRSATWREAGGRVWSLSVGGRYSVP